MELNLIETVIRRQQRRTLSDVIACVLFPAALALASGLLLAL